MSYKVNATQLHDSGCNCCQSVLGSCCERFGLTSEQSYRIGAFLGGGARAGELCGAVSGALMALGLAYGDENNRECEKSAEFLAAFREKFGTLRCGELVDPETQDPHDICPGYINWCCDYLEQEFQ